MSKIFHQIEVCPRQSEVLLSNITNFQMENMELNQESLLSNKRNPSKEMSFEETATENLGKTSKTFRKKGNSEENSVCELSKINEILTLDLNVNRIFYNKKLGI